MSGLEQQLQAAGLELLGDCAAMAQRDPHLLQGAMLLEDFSEAEAGLLGAAMLRVRAATNQVLIREGTTATGCCCCSAERWTSRSAGRGAKRLGSRW